jgi:hypothetical protein
MHMGADRRVGSAILCLTSTKGNRQLLVFSAMILCKVSALTGETLLECFDLDIRPTLRRHGEGQFCLWFIFTFVITTVIIIITLFALCYLENRLHFVNVF